MYKKIRKRLKKMETGLVSKEPRTWVAGRGIVCMAPSPYEVMIKSIGFTKSFKDCWFYVGNEGSVNQYGVPHMTINNKSRSISRVVYKCWIGKIPKRNSEGKKLVVRHKCGKGHLGCLNPTHLELGTHQDNSDDMERDGTKCYGEKHWSFKYDDEMVAHMRYMFESEGFRPRVIAATFGMSPKVVSNFIHRENRSNPESYPKWWFDNGYW